MGGVNYHLFGEIDANFDKLREPLVSKEDKSAIYTLGRRSALYRERERDWLMWVGFGRVIGCLMGEGGGALTGSKMPRQHNV